VIDMNAFIHAGCCLLFVFLFGCATKAPPLNSELIHSSPIIADHNSVNLHLIPHSNMQNAKEHFGISYGHTSHARVCGL